MIVDAPSGTVMELDSSSIVMDVEDQVAIVRSTQRFVNNSGDTLRPKYGYPMPAAANAIQLRWRSDGPWYVAAMVAEPQDTLLPGTGGQQGGTAHPDLMAYLGDAPLYFRMQEPVPPGVSVTVELSYVELLTYANARVELDAGADLSVIMSGNLPQLHVMARIRSQRPLIDVDLTGTGNWIPGAAITAVSADSALLELSAAQVPIDHRFTLGYMLDPAGYGLICMSNYLPDSLVKCDEMDNGFFLLLIEPEPTSEVVNKDIVIVIDRSGSMSGSKIADAQDAAEFIVNNLNAGDRFNVITFNSDAQAWSSELVPADASNRTAALNWIGQLTASGGTSINSAVTLGMNNYTTTIPSHARPMILLTDGQDSEPNQTILNNAMQLRQQIASDLQLFTFGIGDGFNEQLLNQLAVQNNGTSQFLEAANFLPVMNAFYTMIQDPVMVEPVGNFDRPDIQNIHPLPLMGLFVGQQLAIVGRYDQAGPAHLQLSGVAGGVPVSLDYSFELTGTYAPERSFLPKVWAQKAIGALLNEYYSHPIGSATGLMLEDSITSYSMCYGISSPFTSFTDDSGGGVVTGEEEFTVERERPLTYPEPSLNTEAVTFDLSSFNGVRQLVLRLYDEQGRLVLERDLRSAAGGQWNWNGLDQRGVRLKGVLFYQLITEHGLTRGRMTRL